MYYNVIKKHHKKRCFVSLYDSLGELGRRSWETVLGIPRKNQRLSVWLRYVEIEINSKILI